MKKRKFDTITIINLLLVILILAAICYKFNIFGNNDRLLIEYKYNEEDAKLSKLLFQKSSVEKQHKLSLAVFFNISPKKNEIDTLNKIYETYSKKLNMKIFFSKNFNLNAGYSFPKQVVNRKIICKKNEIDIFPNFFIILQDRNLVSCNSSFKLFDMTQIIRKFVFPDYNFSHYHIGHGKIKEKVLGRINSGDLKLFDVETNSFVNLRNVFIKESLYIIHADCSTCELQKYLRKYADNHIIIFSVYTDLNLLVNTLVKIGCSNRVLVDINDEFGLMQSNPILGPVIINNKDIGG